MNASHKDPEQNAINTTKVGLLKYAQSVLTMDRAPRWEGEVVKPDIEGQRIFNAKFIPKFEAAYSDWVKKGKSPMDFPTQANIDQFNASQFGRAGMDGATILQQLQPAPAQVAPAAAPQAAAAAPAPEPAHHFQFAPRIAPHPAAPAAPIPPKPGHGGLE